MPVDVAGAAVGTAFGELFKLVNQLVRTVAAFRGQLKNIQTTLGSIEPIIKDIDKFNNLLDRGPEEMAPIKVLLEEGQGLVSECLKIHKLNMCRKYTHSRKLTHFNAAVLERFQLYMPLLNSRDKKEALMEAKEIGRGVKTTLFKKLCHEAAIEAGETNMHQQNQSPLTSSKTDGPHDVRLPNGEQGNQTTNGNDTEVVHRGESRPSQSGKNEIGSRNSALTSNNIQVDAEWLEQYEPGVYVTLVALHDGTRDIMRVRFSRRRFGEHQAKTWWSENRERVCERYNVSASKTSSASSQAARRSEGSMIPTS